MVTNETKNGRKFIKMYDPETGEYLGPLVQPKDGFELFEDKDPLWKQPEEQFSHIALQESGTITLEVDETTAENIAAILNIPKPVSLYDSIRGSKNAAEIFCRITDCSYNKFNYYALETVGTDPEDLPDSVKKLSSHLDLIFKLADIHINHRLLARVIYKYYNIPDIDVLNTVYHLVEVAIELKEEGMIE